MSIYSNPPDAPYSAVPIPPPQPKKSNKTLWIVLGSIAAVVVLACCGGGALVFLADDDKSIAGDSNADGGDEKAAEGDEKDDAAKAGDTVSDGEFDFTVGKVEDGVKSVGDEVLGKEAAGQFVIIHVTVKNTGDAAELFSDTEQKLIDAEGKQYDADSEAGLYIDGNEGLLENINPGNKIDVQLVFDIPKKTELDSVLLVGSIGSEGVPVKL